MRVTANGLRLREDPGVEGEVLETLAAGTLLYVIDNPSQLSPIPADGTDWYWVTWSPEDRPWPVGFNSSGFVAAGPGTHDYLGLAEVACEGPSSIASILAMTPFARAECLGGQEIIVSGSVVSGFGGAPAPGVYEPGWLAHPFGSFGAIADDADTIFTYRYAPGVDYEMWPDETQLRLRGHYADPASESCVIDQEATTG